MVSPPSKNGVTMDLPPVRIRGSKPEKGAATIGDASKAKSTLDLLLGLGSLSMEGT